MTTRRFCDCCSNEALVDYVEKGHKAEIMVNGKHKIVLKTELDASTERDLCTDCMASALYEAAIALSPRVVIEQRYKPDEAAVAASLRRPRMKV